MTDLSLFQLAREYQEASSRLTDLDLPDEVIADTLEGMAGGFEDKAQNTAFVIRNLESAAEKIKQAEDSMEARRKAIESRAKRIRTYLLENMEACAIKKIECPYFSISVRQNPGSVVIDDESAIPADYMREIPARQEPDKALIKSAIKDGFVVPGAHIAAGTRLEIK